MMTDKKKYITRILIGLLVIMASCSIEPSPINYGEDECHRCKMIISGKRFGAELITTKGKVFKYDAIECLIPAFLEKGENHFSQILVTSYHPPFEFIDARDASYLVSQQLPSPMGAYLSAYRSYEIAAKTEEQYNGEIFDWDSIVLKFKDE